MKRKFDFPGRRVSAMGPEENSLRITALPVWDVYNISDSDEVIVLSVQGPIYGNELLDRKNSLNLLGFDEASGKILLWDVDDHTEFEIKGKIDLQKRWYTKEEIIHLAREAYEAYSYEIERLHEVQNTLNKARSYVTEAFKRSEIKLSAGKKVNFFDLLKQISTILRGPR